MKCADCGGEYLLTNKLGEFEVRGETFEVGIYERYVCQNCGEELFPASVASKLQRTANDLYRQKHKMMTGQEIQVLRAEHNIAQEELEDILGVGKKTVARWENGKCIQSKTADTLLRVFQKFPAAFDWSRQKATDEHTDCQ
jgi:putative zinc finger/helix-turn-helix YgiT family protein